MPPGIIHVSSRIAHLRVPRADVALLEPRAFCAWYEERHIGEVVRLPGVSGAGRWEAESEGEFSLCFCEGGGKMRWGVERGGRRMVGRRDGKGGGRGRWEKER